ncbi:MAG: porin [Planctomycetales bacterium]
MTSRRLGRALCTSALIFGSVFAFESADLSAADHLIARTRASHGESDDEEHILPVLNESFDETIERGQNADENVTPPSVEETPEAAQDDDDPFRLLSYGPEFVPPGAVAAPPPPPYSDMPPGKWSTPLSAAFGNGTGFQFQSKESDFSLQFHNLTQVDGRFYGTNNQFPVHDTFEMPREWLIWSGKLTKQIEYFGSFAFGFDNVNLLDAFVNFHYRDEFQVKVGRYKTPFTYEFYAEPIQGLINPERSLFFNNFGMNRDIGVMIHGTVYDKKVDYAVGTFNGSRNGYVDQNDAKEIMSYGNYRPFQDWDCAMLQNLNIGGSMVVGDANQAPPIPAVLRTSVATIGNGVNGIPFLAFNNGVREEGMHSLWTGHVALYHEQLSFISELQGGHQKYSQAGNNQDINIWSYYAQAGYFLTGEVVTARNVVKPLNDFNPVWGCWGWGAWEATYRFNSLKLGDNVFSSGIANAALWTNSLYTNDVGMTWYPTQHLKLFLCWENAQFSTPVVYNTNTGAQQTASNTYWSRLQLYY